MTILFETTRLILKSPSLLELDDIFALRSDPEVMQYIASDVVKTKKEVKNFILQEDSYFKKYGFAFCSVFEKKAGNFIGQAGLFHLRFDPTQPDIELGYRLHKKYWGQGYATELAKALIQWGFEVKALPKIVALAHSHNEASKKVLQKAGMQYHGIFTDEKKQLLLYTITRVQFCRK